jgi:hypothetical protein
MQSQSLSDDKIKLSKERKIGNRCERKGGADVWNSSIRSLGTWLRRLSGDYDAIDSTESGSNQKRILADLLDLHIG